MKARVNAVIVSDFAYVAGGAEKVAVGSAIALANHGWRVVFFSAVPPVSDVLLQVPNLQVVCLDQSAIRTDENRLRAVLQGLWNVKAARELAAALKGLDPRMTILHFHSWTRALSTSVVHTAVRNGFPVVCTLHSYHIACPNGGFFNYPIGTICHAKPLTFRCVFSDCDRANYLQKCWRVMRHVVERPTLSSGVKNYVTVSAYSQRLLQPFLPSDARVRLLPNPVQVSRMPRVEAENNSLFVFVGRLSLEKGAELLAKAAARLRCEALFVGDGELSSLILKLCPSARVTGWLPPDQALQELHAARALVFPSPWYEVQPLVVLEAAALGVPAIVSDAGAASEMVIDGVTGMLFRSGDVNDLCAKMSLLRDDGLVRHLSTSTYQRYWEDPPTMEKHIQQLMGLYDEILRDF